MANYYVAIKFINASKSYYFSTDLDDLKIGDFVVAESIRGLQIGSISSEISPIAKYKSNLELKPIMRKANKEDMLVYEENIKKADKALKIATEEINKLNLEMRPIEAEYTLDGTKLTITYVSDERIDFRELLKILASKFHCRIELRQIGPRDKAKMIGGIGICGLPLCCSRFFSLNESISISKAKNQMLSINIPKLSGHCGKLICCLLFEDETYTELKKDFPHIGDTYIKDKEKYKITGINILSRTIKIEKDGDIAFIPLKELKEKYKFTK